MSAFIDPVFHPLVIDDELLLAIYELDYPRHHVRTSRRERAHEPRSTVFRGPVSGVRKQRTIPE